MRKATVFSLVLAMLLLASSVHAQFGKNQVRSEDWTWQYYPTDHFEVYHYLDLKDSKQHEMFTEVLIHLELSYKEFSEFYNFRVPEAIPVIIHKTLGGGFDTDKVLGDPFLPEGLGGVTEPERGRTIQRLDLIPPLNRQVLTHELDHAFYFQQVKRKLSIAGFGSRPLFFIEGSRAIYVSNLIEPSTRDEFRHLKYRKMAFNSTAHLPTWEMMENESCWPGKICDYYTYGDMVSVFIEKTYGQEAVKKYLINGTNETNKPLFAVLNEAVGKRWESKEQFDEDFSRFWETSYRDIASKPKFNTETENYIGRRVLPPMFRNDAVSPVLSPDGTNVAFFSVGEYGVIIAKTPLLRAKELITKKGQTIMDYKKENNYEEVFSSFPPVPYEYCISQDFVTWPSNGFDLDWSKNNKLALFCKSGKDHVLVLSDVKTRERKEFKIPLDQAFSPAFSPDGKLVYFAAAKNTVRDIYKIDLETGEFANLTNDLAFDSAPSVSSDGTKLVYVSFIKDIQKIFLLDLSTGAKTQLTFNRYNDNCPSFFNEDKSIAYLSDKISQSSLDKKQEDRIWNLYTMDLETQTVNQWTDSPAGVFTPRFVQGADDRVILVSWADRQFGGTQFPIDMIYELRLKKSVETFIMRDEKQVMDWTFRTNELFKFEPDENQVDNPDNFRHNWKLRNNGVSFGYDTYWSAAWGSGGFEISDILEEYRHSFMTGLYGDVKIIDYTYTDLSKRRYWGFKTHHENLPLYYMSYNIFKGAPAQQALSNVWMSSTGFNLFTLYPKDKFNRFEFRVGLERRKYPLFGLSSSSAIDQLSQDDAVNPEDFAFYNFFNKSQGGSVQLEASYVRDTVVYANGVQGPYNGNAVRIDFRVAPAISGRNRNNISMSVNTRRYMRLGSGSTLALRGDGVANKNPDGKFVIIGGNDTLRGYTYGSIAGNNMAYVSSELRFPLIEGIILPGNNNLGAIRGLAFADYSITKFSDGNLPAVYGKSYGLGFQFFSLMPMNFVWANTPNKKWKFDFYVSYNW